MLQAVWEDECGADGCVTTVVTHPGPAMSHRTLTPLDIISFGRLGNVVKKALLLCSVSDESHTPVYTSFQWTGSK